MPDERAYFMDLAREARIRVRFRWENGQMVQFLVQLEYLTIEGWVAVARYDNAHGRPHMDILDRSGDVMHKRWLSASNADVLTMGIDEFKHNWEHYIARFKEGS